MSVQIERDKLNAVNGLSDAEIGGFFGEWTNKVDALRDAYAAALPFEHVVVDDFLNTGLAQRLSTMYPPNLADWHHYNNPVEVKYAYDNLARLDPELERVFYLLSSDYITGKMRKMSNVALEIDPYLHGAGLHMHPRYGRLGLHLDYEKHPYTGKQRRLNVILYLSKEWNDAWKGQSELWNADVSKRVAESRVRFNTAIIFKTNEISWHGVPEKIMCPETVFRKSLAYYYVSDLTPDDSSGDGKVGNDGTGFRTKAAFVCRPGDPNKDRLQGLLDIRPHRRIRPEDVEAAWPGWDKATD